MPYARPRGEHRFAAVEREILRFWKDRDVFHRSLEKNAEGELERWLQTSPDLQYAGKDRSGLLDVFEEPNLAAISTKIVGKPTRGKKAAA